jgi:hypothetical protein
MDATRRMLAGDRAYSKHQAEADFLKQVGLWIGFSVSIVPTLFWLRFSLSVVEAAFCVLECPAWLSLAIGDCLCVGKACQCS